MLTTMLFAIDVDQMANFYRTTFDLSADSAASQPGFVVLVGAGVRVALHETPDQLAETIEIADPPDARTATAMKMIFAVADVANTRARIQRSGGVVFDPTDDDAFDALDPEGNVFRVHAR